MANLNYIDAEYVKSGTASQVGNTVIGTPDLPLVWVWTIKFRR